MNKSFSVLAVAACCLAAGTSLPGDTPAPAASAPGAPDAKVGAGEQAPPSKGGGAPAKEKVRTVHAVRKPHHAKKPVPKPESLNLQRRTP